MASCTELLLRCALPLLLLRRNRSQLDYSRSVDDLAIRVEARAVAGAVPCFFGAVPANDAVKMGTNRGSLVDVAVLVTIHRKLAAPAPDDGAFAGLDGIDSRSLAAGEIILVLLRDVGVFLDVFGRGAKPDSSGVIELGPLVLAALDQLVENDAGDGAVGHAVSRIAGRNPDVVVTTGILPDVGHVVHGLHDLPRPAVINALDHGESLAGPLL